jgi:hypothetical protein
MAEISSSVMIDSLTLKHCWEGAILRLHRFKWPSMQWTLEAEQAVIEACQPDFIGSILHGDDVGLPSHWDDMLWQIGTIC